MRHLLTQLITLTLRAAKSLTRNAAAERAGEAPRSGVGMTYGLRFRREIVFSDH